jgi:hypothetical protein
MPEAPENPIQGFLKFRILLANGLRGLGHEVTDWSSNSDFDIVLDVGDMPECLQQKAKGKKTVIQLFGGVSNWPAEKKATFERNAAGAHGIVYDSAFGMDRAHSALSLPSCREAVIHNGASPDKQSSLGKPIFMMACCTYKTPSKIKALKACALAMATLRDRILGSELWVAGDSPDLPGIDRRLGIISSHKELQCIRKQVSVLLHPIDDESCPNTVIESLGQGIPVVFHARSGLPEIVKDYGKSIGRLSPRAIAVATMEMWVRGVREQKSWRRDFLKNLSIEAISKQYEKFLEEILKC